MARIVWIPIRIDLHTQPEVVAIAATLGVSENEVVGALARFWGWLRSVSRFCCASVAPMFIDRYTALPGLCAALEHVGWIEVGKNDDGTPFVEAVKPEKWLTHGAATRALAAERMGKSRSAKRNTSATDVAPAAQPRANRKRTTPSLQHSTVQEEKTATQSSCSEPPEAASEPPVMEFRTVGKGDSLWPLSPKKLAEYREAFPGVDALAECRKALQWCRDNPARRKTAKGMAKFLGAWLGRAQDRAGVTQNGRVGRHGADMGPHRVRAPAGKYDHLDNGTPPAEIERSAAGGPRVADGPLPGPTPGGVS